MRVILFSLLIIILVFVIKLFYQENVIRINAVGDVMPASNFPSLFEPSEKESTYINILGDWLKVGNPDYVFGNLEGALTNFNKTTKDISKSNTFVFQIPPKYARLLKQLGFKIMSIANNHAMDFKREGFEESKQILKSEGIIPIGDKNKIEFTHLTGKVIAWLAFAWSNFFNSVLNTDESLKLIKEAADKSDILIISVHAGTEGDKALIIKNEMEYLGNEKRGNPIQFAHLAVDYGADLILFHGPHVPRALEVYNNKLIAYSLGNFVTYRSFATSGHQKYTYILQVDLDQQGNFSKGKIYPFIQFENGPYKGIPKFDDKKGTINLIKKLTFNHFPNTPLEITDEGDLLLKSSEFTK
jgi:poly-gamma-glutamate capsule biosynthesis protein CapA/YwtB (metallophosphatase superfamily)